MAINVYKGGRPNALFPAFMGARTFSKPYPTRISDNFARGHYAFGHSLHPICRADQQAEMVGLTGPQTFNLLVAPSYTIIKNAFVKVEPNAPCPGPLSGCGPFGCASEIAEGLLFNVVLRTFNDGDDIQTAEPLETVTLFTAKDAGEYGTDRIALDEYIEEGQIGVVQVVFTNWPTTDPEADYSMLPSFIAVILDATYLDWQVMA